MSETVLRGRAHVLGDSISTDLIAPGRLFHLRSNLPELAKHLLEDVEPDFVRKIAPGDFLVAGRNFGLGSSREHAPTIIKMAGVSAVLAHSFARIFFRNAINVGLAAVECDTSAVQEGDELEVDLKAGTVRNLTRNQTLTFPPLPPVMRRILADGGLAEHVKRHGGFALGG